jgi:hypothetical protein
VIHRGKKIDIQWETSSKNNLFLEQYFWKRMQHFRCRINNTWSTEAKSETGSLSAE